VKKQDGLGVEGRISLSFSPPPLFFSFFSSQAPTPLLCDSGEDTAITIVREKRSSKRRVHCWRIIAAIPPPFFFLFFFFEKVPFSHPAFEEGTRRKEYREEVRKSNFDQFVAVAAPFLFSFGTPSVPSPPC